MNISAKLNAFTDGLVRRVGQASSLDSAAELMGGTADKTVGNPAVRDLLSGTAIGHPVHPLLVAVPIGAFSCVSLFDLTNNRQASETLIAAGIASSIPAAAAGLSDWRYTSGPERRIGLVHAVANSVALALYAASFIRRKRGGSGKLLALGGFSVLGASGYLGGHLAYALGVGVDTNSFAAVPTDWMIVADEAAITEELTVVPVNGANVLLTRANGEVKAMANRCSHRGAPLSDGERDGNCVVCPWHQSKFELSDGALITGPAVRPQMTFDVRVEGGKVLIRHRDSDSNLSTNADAVLNV